MSHKGPEEKRWSTLSTNSAAMARHDLFSNPQNNSSAPVRHSTFGSEDDVQEEDIDGYYSDDSSGEEQSYREQQSDTNQPQIYIARPTGENQTQNLRDSMVSNTSSVRDLRNIFGRSTNQNKTNMSDATIDQDQTLPDINSGSSFHQQEGRDLGVFRSKFDTDSEVDLSEPDASRFSLNSSIISKMANAFNGQGDLIANEEDLAAGADEDERFKYLRTYEKLAKSQRTDAHVKQVIQSMKNNSEIPLQVLKTNTSGTSSLFELSNLDDFNKYVKQTEINDLIHDKIAARNPEEDNVLGVVASSDMAQNFYADDTNFTTENSSRNIKSKPSWVSKDWKLFRSSSKNSRGGDGNDSIPSRNILTNKSKGSWYSRDPKKNPSPVLVDSNELYSDNSLNTGEENPSKRKFLQRKLKVRHLQMISFGGTLGVGLFLNSGKAFTIAGGFGTLLAFVLCGIVVLATIISFCEMVTFISVVDGVSGLSSRFVDDAFGFAVGWLYWASFAFGLAGEVVASVIMLAYYPSLNIPQNTAPSVGFVTLFLLSIVLFNLIDVRIFGEIEYISSLIKLVAALVMIVVMIVLNTGGINNTPYIGFKYWKHSDSDFDNNIIFGLFRPAFNLHDDGTSPPTEGQGGAGGRFLSLLTAIVVVAYAYSGTEIVCIAACEAKNPRKALPSATKRVFWRIIIFYCLSAFMVSLNIYSGDPRLLRYLSGSTGIDQSEFATNYAIQYVGGANCKSDSPVFAGFGSGAQSPWIIALQSAKLCDLSSAVNAFFVFFAVSCGNAQLYVSSRTLYSLALQKKAPKFLTYCSSSGIPYNAVLFSASFGLLSYICVSEEATLVFQNLTSIIASSGVLVWFAMCLSYIRFFYGLKRRPDIIGRDDKSYPYKSPFQPYSAFVGLFGSSVILLAMGFVVFMKDEWSVMFFFSSYGTLLVFAVLYLGYKLVKGTRIPSLDTLDFDSGRTEMDRYIWDGGRDYNIRNFKDVMNKWVSFLA